MFCSGLSSFFSLGETLKAIDIMGEHGWVDMLTDVGRKLDRAESEGIARVAFYLRQHGQVQYAREVFMYLLFKIFQIVCNEQIKKLLSH